MSNGHPISAIVGRADVLSGVGSTKMTATFFANSAEMAAAITTISILKETNAIAHIWSMGRLFEQGINKVISEYKIPAKYMGYPPCPFIQFTIQDMIKIYYGESDYAKYDNSVCQWNQFLKDFCTDEFSEYYSNKLKVAAILWKEVRDSKNEKIYSRELLKKYEDKIEAYCK